MHQYMHIMQCIHLGDFIRSGDESPRDRVRWQDSLQSGQVGDLIKKNVGDICFVPTPRPDL